MEHSPELLRATRFSTAILFALGSLGLANHYENEPTAAQPRVVEAAALPPVVVETIPPTTTTLPPPTTTLPERVVRPRASRSATTVPRLATPPPAPVTITGTKAEWMAEGGIPEENYDEADYIFTKESNWRPDAENRKGCIGVGQNCPDKNGFRWLEQACPDWRNNIICQIKRFHQYAIGRYGSWEAARAHKVRTGWW